MHDWVTFTKLMLRYPLISAFIQTELNNVY